MGSYYIDAVLKGLNGREFSLRTGGTDAKPKIRKFGPTEMAFLLTIAARQPNPGSRHGDLDPICWGDSATLQSLSHIEKSTFFDCKKFLVRLGLVTYAACERHQDPADPERVRNYTNVYRINLDKLREFFPDTGEWRREILGIHDDANISEGVLRALKAYDGRPCSVRKADSAVQNLDSAVRNLDSAVQNLDTYTNTDKEDKNFIATLIKRMADVLGIPSFLIMRPYVENAIRGKYSESVLGLVEGLPTDPQRGWVLTADEPIRALVSQLRKLPQKENDPEWRRRFDPTPEQLLENVPSPDICELTKWAMSATGCRDAKRFVKRLIDILGGLLQQETGREHAVETIAEIEKMKSVCPELKASELLAKLRGPRG